MRSLSRIRNLARNQQIVIDINRKITNLLRNGNLHEARKLFNQHLIWTNACTWNSLINAYMKTGHGMDAHLLFDRMPHRNVVSWNTMLSGFTDSATTSQVAYRFFLRMGSEGYNPDELTLSILTTTFLRTEYVILIPQLHCLSICLGLNLNRCQLGPALMRGYMFLGLNIEGFVGVFDEMLLKDVMAWNTLTLGYMRFGMTSSARKAFEIMPEKDAFSWSILIDGYMKNKEFYEARTMFDWQRDKDVVSWTTMIRGCVGCGKFVEAAEYFRRMMKSGTCSPNHFTFSSALDACAGCSLLALGNQIHSCIWKFGSQVDVVLATSLVDMYGKCGDICSAFSVFKSALTRNVVSWNSIIGGYARHGLASRALVEFDEMLKSGFIPDKVSFINVLCACVHGGLVKEGEEIFYSMRDKYGVEAEMEHYTCMIDLYGRAGELEKAEKMTRGMPFEPDVVVWGALLEACGLHSCVELGETAANRMSEIEQHHPAVCKYSMVSKLYCGSGGGVESMMQLKWRARKQKAASWIQCPLGN